MYRNIELSPFLFPPPPYSAPSHSSPPSVNKLCEPNKAVFPLSPVPSAPPSSLAFVFLQVMALFDGDTLSTAPSQVGGTVSASASGDNDGGTTTTTVGVILDATPFYAEAGGQVSDCGQLSVTASGEGDDGDSMVVIEVADVRMFGGFALHVGRLVSGRWVVRRVQRANGVPEDLFLIGCCS